MKILPKILVLFLLQAIFSSAKAQVVTSSRPELFSSYSAKIQAPVMELERVFTVLGGSEIELNFGNKFLFTGTVISSLKRYKNLSSVLVKSSIFNNTLLSISKRTNPDNTITYVAHIINDKYADGYQLKQDSTGNYYFTKIKTTDLIQDY